MVGDNNWGVWGEGGLGTLTVGSNLIGRSRVCLCVDLGYRVQVREGRNLSSGPR